MAVDGDVGDVAQDLGRAVAARGEVEQGRRGVDELGRVFVRGEDRMLQQVLYEGDVGADAADAELAQGAVHPGDGGLRGGRPGGDLLQERIVVAGDDRAGIGRAPVQADPHAGGGAIGGDAAVIGDEAVGRILGGDAALDRVPVEMDVVLAGGAGRLDEALALGDQDLRAHDVDAGHLLGDGVLDLHAGVHLDEEELARLHVHQELDGAGAGVADLLGDLLAEAADVLALGLGEVGRGRPLHDLLVASLDRAVALVEVVDVALLVAEDLDLDMAGAGDHLLEIALAVAEGGLGLAPALEHLLLQLVRPVDGAHAPAAAAPGRLEHQGVADGLGLLGNRVPVVAQHLGRGDHWHAGLDRHAARRRLVAEAPHDRGRRADEREARRGHGVDEVGVLRQQAVSRMHRVGAGSLGDADHLLDGEVGRDRAHPLADPVGLVGLEAVEAELVLLGVDRDRLQPELVGGAHHADRDLAAVGDQDLAELGHLGAPMLHVRHGIGRAGGKGNCVPVGVPAPDAPGPAGFPTGPYTHTTKFPIRARKALHSHPMRGSPGRKGVLDRNRVL